MALFLLLDVAPDPVGTGALLAVVLFVIGLILLFAAAFVVFLWYRKRSMRGIEMSRSDTLPTASPAQPNNPNQP